MIESQRSAAVATEKVSRVEVDEHGCTRWNSEGFLDFQRMITERGESCGGMFTARQLRNWSNELVSQIELSASDPQEKAYLELVKKAIDRQARLMRNPEQTVSAEFSDWLVVQKAKTLRGGKTRTSSRMSALGREYAAVLTGEQLILSNDDEGYELPSRSDLKNVAKRAAEQLGESRCSQRYQTLLLRSMEMRLEEIRRIDVVQAVRASNSPWQEFIEVMRKRDRQNRSGRPLSVRMYERQVVFAAVKLYSKLGEISDGFRGQVNVDDESIDLAASVVVANMVGVADKSGTERVSPMRLLNSELDNPGEMTLGQLMCTCVLSSENNRNANLDEETLDRLYEQVGYPSTSARAESIIGGLIDGSVLRREFASLNMSQSEVEEAEALMNDKELECTRLDAIELLLSEGIGGFVLPQGQTRESLEKERAQLRWQKGYTQMGLTEKAALLIVNTSRKLRGKSEIGPNNVPEVSRGKLETWLVQQINAFANDGSSLEARRRRTLCAVIRALPVVVGVGMPVAQVATQLEGFLGGLGSSDDGSGIQMHPTVTSGGEGGVGFYFATPEEVQERITPVATDALAADSQVTLESGSDDRDILDPETFTTETPISPPIEDEPITNPAEFLFGESIYPTLLRARLEQIDQLGEDLLTEDDGVRWEAEQQLARLRVIYEIEADDPGLAIQELREKMDNNQLTFVIVGEDNVTVGFQAQLFIEELINAGDGSDENEKLGVLMDIYNVSSGEEVRTAVNNHRLTTDVLGILENNFHSADSSIKADSEAKISVLQEVFGIEPADNDIETGLSLLNEKVNSMKDRNFDHGHADQVHVLTIDLETGSIRVVSLPRDLVVPEVDAQRVNMATFRDNRYVPEFVQYQDISGLVRLCDLGENMTGEPVDGAISFSMDGAAQFVDTLFPDGIEITHQGNSFKPDTWELMVAANHGSAAGADDAQFVSGEKYHLSGSDVVAYVRSRYSSDANQRVDRTGNMLGQLMQIVLQSAKDQGPDFFQQTLVNFPGAIAQMEETGAMDVEWELPISMSIFIEAYIESVTSPENLGRILKFLAQSDNLAVPDLKRVTIGPSADGAFGVVVHQSESGGSWYQLNGHDAWREDGSEFWSDARDQLQQWDSN